jgi:hypothetical protein
MASQRPQGGGILPTKTLEALNDLVDRLNHTHVANNETIPQLSVLALLVGTNEGIPLSRSYGTIHSIQQASISEELISSIETKWATLPSPHVKNAMNMNLHMFRNDGNNGSHADAHTIAQSQNGEGGNGQNADIQQHHEPPHPLLSQLGLGNTVRTTMAFYDHVTVIHVHIAPLVVTILASTSANLGAVKSMAVPLLTDLLNPVKDALVRIRYEVVNGGHAHPGGNGSLGIGGNGVSVGHNMSMS